MMTSGWCAPQRHAVLNRLCTFCAARRTAPQRSCGWSTRCPPPPEALAAMEIGWYVWPTMENVSLPEDLAQLNVNLDGLTCRLPMGETRKRWTVSLMRCRPP